MAIGLKQQPNDSPTRIGREAREDGSIVPPVAYVPRPRSPLNALSSASRQWLRGTRYALGRLALFPSRIGRTTLRLRPLVSPISLAPFTLNMRGQPFGRIRYLGAVSIAIGRTNALRGCLRFSYLSRLKNLHDMKSAQTSSRHRPSEAFGF